ncbi:helix-turn-helix domain-containing protein [uncultured Clostridium sp.]|uniref:helix-turn-helix domain-containing protein n=1 Tax=uncultured Clostridium sp. TaxID=59620 RepID=UPI0025F55A47|nr:helix-turn-helix transcriptional regulator [uncultured Clostridium sp.]
MNTGNKIKELRKKRGLTQEELAQECGLSKNGIWNYENNKRIPTVNTLNKIADALDISFSELLDINPLSENSNIYTNDKGAVTEVIPKTNNVNENLKMFDTDILICECITRIGNEMDYILLGEDYNRILEDIKNILKGDITKAKIERGLKIR